jgi:Wiskott-Aldrich syndrome protein
MDAPRISTLRDEDSPPQPTNKLSKKRPHKAILSGGAGKEPDEVDDEEDQLVDELVDDDDTARLSPSARSTDAAQKRKPSVKKKSRKGEKKAGELEKKKAAVAAVPGIVPTISIFKAHPTNSLENMDMTASSGLINLSESAAPKGKKKVSPRKSTAIPRTMVGRLAK